MTATATLTKKRKSSGVHLDLSALRAALATVSPAVPGKASKPILMNVLLGSGLLTASDLELQIQTAIDWHDDALLLPAARLQSILKECNGDNVTLSSDGTLCTVRVGRGSWNLPTETAAEYPTWEPADATPVCRLPADQFCRAVKSVAYATDNESSRYALGAVLVEVKEGTVHFVGTDGRRLSVYEAEVDQAVDDRTVLIPARAIAVMARVAAHSEGAVQLEATGNEVVAECDGTTVTARLTDGRFPRWRDTLPERDAKSSLVSAAELLAATRQAAICTSEQSLGVQFVFTADGIHLTGRAAEAGESSVTCPLEQFGQACSVKMDPRFVVDFLRNLDDLAVPVEIEAVDATSAVVFRCDDATGVVMPLDPSA
jgi:DNA polymerase-3 subunit beta